MDLTDFREQIDKIDEELLNLFANRMDVVRQVALFKKENNLPVLDATRENEKLSKIDDPYAQELFKTLFKLSREYQKVQLND